MPTFSTIADTKLQLNANAESVHSNLGNGQLGLLALTVALEEYRNLTDTAFIAPINPGPTPIIPTGATGPQIDRLEEEHIEATRNWKEYLATDTALKQQLLSAFDDMYCRSLRDIHIGYVVVTTCQLLEH